jgi:hypothetical protein
VAAPGASVATTSSSGIGKNAPSPDPINEPGRQWASRWWPSSRPRPRGGSSPPRIDRSGMSMPPPGFVRVAQAGRWGDQRASPRNSSGAIPSRWTSTIGLDADAPAVRTTGTSRGHRSRRTAEGSGVTETQLHQPADTVRPQPRPRMPIESGPSSQSRSGPSFRPPATSSRAPVSGRVSGPSVPPRRLERRCERSTPGRTRASRPQRRRFPAAPGEGRYARECP